MRELIALLDRLGIRWFVTGSEAAACYGVLRQTFDTDVVVDLPAGRFGELAGGLTGYAVADPIEYPGLAMGSVISTQTAEKVDIIMRQISPWTTSAMERRQRWRHPDFGEIWVSSMEDLILAKLEWSEGTSELQLRDCRQLIALNQQDINWGYLEGWASRLGVSALLASVRDAT